MSTDLTRRAALTGALAFAASLPAHAQVSDQTFAQWRETFRARARARGISDETYDRVMRAVEPDTSVYALDKNQAEFKEKIWQYLLRRVTDWRIQKGREKLKEQDALFDRIEREIGVDRWTMLGFWGNESSFGEVMTNPRLMRPVFPALAALAWGEPRRRKYWETELLNALVIVQRGWAEPTQMVGSWAGAMGHTQWMPEVWLNIGIDFNGDGRANPFQVEDALAGTARYILRRGRYQKGEVWGFEVRVPDGIDGNFPDARRSEPRSIAAWRSAGVTPARGQWLDIGDNPRLWQPMANGPGFLLGQNFYALRSYNPASAYALSVAHLGDRIKGDPPFVQPFPGAERALSLAEVQEIQQRLTAAGFDTGGTTGAVGSGTRKAVADWQRSVGMDADGWPGERVLTRLRQAR